MNASRTAGSVDCSAVVQARSASETMCELLRSVRIARADLHGAASVANHVAPAVIDRLRCPVAARTMHWLSVAIIDHIAARPRRQDGAGDDRAARLRLCRRR